MQSRWSDEEARSFVERYMAEGEDLALRVYTSRLIGSDPDLVLHGGGNTSVKSTFRDLLGEPVPAIFVKGSGWNLDSLAPEGCRGCVSRACNGCAASPPSPTRNGQPAAHPSLPRRRGRTLGRGPAPCLPAGKFIDHSHADAILALTNRPDGEAVVREVYGERVGSSPMSCPVRPGPAAAEVHDAQPALPGSSS